MVAQYDVHWGHVERIREAFQNAEVTPGGEGRFDQRVWDALSIETKLALHEYAPVPERGHSTHGQSAREVLDAYERSMALPPSNYNDVEPADVLDEDVPPGFEKFRGAAQALNEQKALPAATERINDLTTDNAGEVQDVIVLDTVENLTSEQLAVAKQGVRDGFYGTPSPEKSSLYLKCYAEGFYARKGNHALVDGVVLRWRASRNMGSAGIGGKDTKRSRKDKNNATTKTFVYGYKRSEKIINLLKQAEEEASEYSFKDEKTMITGMLEFMIEQMIELKEEQEARTTSRSGTASTNKPKVIPKPADVQKLTKEKIEELKNKVKEGRESVVAGKSPSRFPDRNPVTLTKKAQEDKDKDAVTEAAERQDAKPASTPSMPVGSM